MNFDALSSEKIADALYFLDVDDRMEWVTAAMCLKSELGEGGKQMWLDWSSQGVSFKMSDALSTWKSVKATGKTRIGTLIFMAIQRGFRLGDYTPVSKQVQEERRVRREKAEKEAEIEQKKLEEKQKSRAMTAAEFFEKAETCYAHEYTSKKDVGCYGLKVSDWPFNGDSLKDALIMPLRTFEAGIVSLQAIFADGEKKMLAGAQKSGAFHVIGEDTDIIVIGEGYATCATIHEATGFQVYVALDAGNLIKVAHAVREHNIMAKIVIAADNDQYGKTNTGLKAAIKAACEVDADIVCPTFKDTSSRPTDFNDLAALEGLDAVKVFFKVEHIYKPKKTNAMSFDAWDLDWIEDSNKVLEESDSEIEIAKAAKVEALKMAKGVPAFCTIEQIRKHIDHPMLARETHVSIMKQVQWSIYSRKKIAMGAIRPESWGNKHNFLSVSSLDDFKSDTAITLVAAPMGAGKTKNIIKPFSDASDNFLAIAHRRSLIADLSKRLCISSYDSVKSQDHALAVDKMAICLPSTQSLVLKPFVDRAANLAIDEISQNLRFTRSGECKVQGANQDSIFTGLKQIISESKKVIACDASIDKTTLDFFEAARPDERFTIVEQAPKNHGRKCFLYAEKSDFLTTISLELKSGGKVWLAVESAEKAEIISEIMSCEKTIVITSKTAKTKKVKEFLDDIEAKSRDYDLVIASPAISSGVSVEHADGAHFTMIAGMASGHSICFSDFAQMLGRVRYVKDYHIHLSKNNHKNNNLTELSILTGLRQAAAIEGGDFRENEFSRFKAMIEAKEDAYKADFANGLIWFLEYFCFKIESKKAVDSDTDLSEKMKLLSKEKKEEYISRVIGARKITKEEAEDIKASFSITEDESYELQAYRVRKAFNFCWTHDLTETDLDMVEDLAKIDRMASFLGLKRDGFDDSLLNISLRRFQDAKIVACNDLFDGFDLDFITQESCDDFIKKASSNKNRFLLSSLKLIPIQYGEWKEDKSGRLKDYPIPSKTGKSVAVILERFGMPWVRSNSRSHGNFYKIDRSKFDLFRSYAEKRYS